MKCLQYLGNNEDYGDVIRVSDDEAHEYVTKLPHLYKYVPKRVWKARKQLGSNRLQPSNS